MEETQKKGKLVLVLTLLLVVFVIAGGAFYYYRGNSKNILNNSFKLLSQKTNKLKETTETYLHKDTTIEGNIKIDLDVNEMLLEEDMTFAMVEALLDNLDINYTLSSKEGKTLLDMESNKAGKSFLSLNAYLEGSNVFVKSKELFDRYIELGDIFETEETETKQLEDGDIDYIYCFLTKSFVNNIEKDNLKKSDATIKLDGKDTKVTKTSVELNNKDVNDILKKINEDIKNDARAKRIAKTIGLDIAYLLDEDTIEEEAVDGLLTYSVYTSGLLNKTVGMELLFKDDITEVKLEFIENKDSSEISVYGEKELLVKLVFQTTKEEEKITIIVDEKDVATLTKNIDKKELTLKVNFELEGVALSLLTTTTSKDNTHSTVGEGKLSMMGMDLVKLTFSESTTTKEGAEINVDVTNSVKMEELTPEDQNDIMLKLYNLFAQ